MRVELVAVHAYQVVVPWRDQLASHLPRRVPASGLNPFQTAGIEVGKLEFGL
jgi:hypothetical protein